MSKECVGTCLEKKKKILISVRFVNNYTASCVYVFRISNLLMSTVNRVKTISFAARQQFLKCLRDDSTVVLANVYV